MGQIWMRMGVSLDVSDSEVKTILSGNDRKAAARTIENVLKEGRFSFDGEAYIPESVAETVASQQGLSISPNTLEFDLPGLKGFRSLTEPQKADLATPALPQNEEE